MAQDEKGTTMRRTSVMAMLLGVGVLLAGPARAGLFDSLRDKAKAEAKKKALEIAKKKARELAARRKVADPPREPCARPDWPLATALRFPLRGPTAARCPRRRVAARAGAAMLCRKVSIHSPLRRRPPRTCPPTRMTTSKPADSPR